MFSFFKKKSPIEKLQNRYDQLMQEAFNLSKTNRTESDKKHAEANEIMKEIEALEKKNNP